jgi:hypothetical protein
MGWLKPSASVEKKKQILEYNVRLQKAENTIREQANMQGTKQQAVATIAKEHQVNRSTLQARLDGRCTKAIARQAQQTLSGPQETILVGWIKYWGHRGVPMSKEKIHRHASLISGKPIGINWIYRFEKHHPDLKFHWTQKLDACRAQALNRTNVMGCYDIVESLIQEYGITPENIYNMDEKGVQLGDVDRVRVLVDRDQKTVHNIGDANREMVTIIECISADGKSLKPCVIFKGHQQMGYWHIPGANPAEAS